MNYRIGSLKKRDGLELLIFGVVFLTLVLLPCLYLFPDINPYDEKRIAQVVLLILVGFFFIINKWVLRSDSTPLQRYVGISNIAKWGIVIFLALGLASTWVNGHWFFGLQLLSMYLLLFIFFLFTAGCYRQNPSQFKKVIYILVGGYAALYFFKFGIGYGLYLWGNYPLWPYKASVSTLFGWSNIRFFNQVQTWTLPLLVSISLSIKNRSWLLSRIVLALVAFWWCLVFASGAQGSLAALIGSAIFVCLLFGKKTWKWIKILLISFLIGLVLYFLMFYLQEADVATVLDDSTKGRLVLWSLISEQILLKPFLGFGPLSLASYQNLPKMVHPHNAILQMVYEFGIPATIIASGLIGWGIIRWFSWNRKILREEKVNNREKYLRIGLSVSLCAGLAHSLVSGVLVTPLSQLWFCIIAGWAWGIYLKERKETVRQSQKAAQWMYSSLVMASILWMMVVLWHDVPKLEEYRQNYIENTSYNGYPPRFWQQGKTGLEENP